MTSMPRSQKISSLTVIFLCLTLSLCLGPAKTLLAAGSDTPASIFVNPDNERYYNNSNDSDLEGEPSSTSGNSRESAPRNRNHGGHSSSFHPVPLQDTNESRPGYRPTVTYESQEFYRHIMDKLARGEKLTVSDNIIIRAMIAARLWPEAPAINENDRAAEDYIGSHDTYTTSAMEMGRATGGKLDFDVHPRGDLEKFRQWYYSLPPDRRPYMAKVMMIYYKSMGIDMRSDEQIAYEKNEKEKYSLRRQEQRENERREEEERRRAQQKADEDFFRRARIQDARRRLKQRTRRIREGDESDPAQSWKEKSWDEMTPEERHEALKANDPNAWEQVTRELKKDLESSPAENQPETDNRHRNDDTKETASEESSSSSAPSQDNEAADSSPPAATAPPQPSPPQTVPPAPAPPPPPTQNTGNQASKTPTKAELAAARRAGRDLKIQLKSGGYSSDAVRAAVREAYGQYENKLLKQAFREGYSGR